MNLASETAVSNRSLHECVILAGDQAVETISEVQVVNDAVNGCFGCGLGNQIGLRLTFQVAASEKGVLTSTAAVQLDRRFEGSAGFLHGGILATLMDEAMSKLNRPLGVKAMTRHLEIDYLRPSPAGEPLRLVGTHLRRDGRKLLHAAELRDQSGILLVKASGVFIVQQDAHP